MMREIKFRQAIYIRGKFRRFHYWGEIEGQFLGPVCDNQEWAKNSDQYIGQEDKRDAKTWEGDTVEIEQSGIGQIIWDQENLSFFWVRKPGGKQIFEGIQGVTRHYTEVVGNRHENPELAEAQGDDAPRTGPFMGLSRDGR